MKTRHVFLSLFIVVMAASNYMLAEETMDLPHSEYVTLVITVPESHADAMRESLGRAGAGKWGNYSFCSFSVKGVARFLPHDDADPFVGCHNVLETVIEERIETVCKKEQLESVLEAIKKAHPYEETVIEIYPIYQIGCKFQSS